MARKRPLERLSAAKSARTTRSSRSGWRSRRHHDFHRLAVVHRAVALRDSVEPTTRSKTRPGSIRPPSRPVGAPRCRRARARGRRDGDVAEKADRRPESRHSGARRRAPRRPRPRDAPRRAMACRGARRTPAPNGRQAAGQLRNAFDAAGPRSLTMSVAPNSFASAMRSGWRPRRMICSAPSRFAAITPQSPTAPSPSTATSRHGAPGPRPRRGARCP